MDLAYLRAHPHRVPMLIEHQRIRCTPVPGGSVGVAQRLTLDDGGDVFAKFVEDGPAGLLHSEAAGLRWLAEAGGPPVPEVVSVADEVLVLDWVPAGEATAHAAEEFGAALARMHRAGAEGFGAPWRGFIGRLGQDNGPGEDWPSWFAERRLLPYLKESRDTGALSTEDVVAVEAVLGRVAELAGPAEAPARLHGDLWPGNVHWAADGRAWLIDPAAHGGHRETDLAQLGLWGGAPHLDRILAAYDEVHPLAGGWRERRPLHRLHLLLVHTALFGATFRDEVVSAVAELR
ncbi:fructosamine kinase family protein [Phytomonospora endophytica]|uniref:Fructosamine-3-kinase n=1 Tax=Phytomonospora endophytica TaxID=714109 RepID=A0A841FQG9_9ACTN|nr:fructosamine kinase family protein [Phytomonospora endophytica]MBB6035497.1 fructosamine-3-kinase [Phytomonospora endophytica]GIG63750.1 fructosamine kinase [Phytomonospora endophytica]